MKHVKLSLLALLVALLALGCWDTQFNQPEDTADGDDDPTLSDTESSGCKTDNAPRMREDGTVDNTPIPGVNPIQAIAQNGRVTIIHHNAIYHCDADIFFIMQVKDGNRLILNEVDRAEMVTDCICPFDLSVDILNLTPGIYHIEVWDQYNSVLFGQVTVRLGDCPDQCRVDEDCLGGVYMELPPDAMWCPGRIGCLNGMCQWICEDEKYRCQSDYDCPGGYQCVWYGGYDDKPYPGQNTDPATGTNSEGRPDVATDLPYYECRSDFDCPEGMWCELENCGPDGNCAAPDGRVIGYCTGGDVPPQPDFWGYCEPIPQPECYSNADCPRGYQCVIYGGYDDKPYPGQDIDPETGVDNGTRPDGTPGTDPSMPYYECMTDADCPAGMWCELKDCGPNTDCAEPYGYPTGYCMGGEVPPQPWGYCEPMYQGECYSNEECPRGYHCEFYDYGNGQEPYPGEPDSSGRPTDENAPDAGFWGGGVCVPDYVPNSCEDMGGRCMGQWEDNWGCPEGWEAVYELMYQEPLCGVGGICCVPANGGECTTDRDCQAMYGDSADGSTWVCMYGKCQPHAGCFDYACASDRDCQGGTCVFWEEDCPYEGDGCCAGSYCSYDDACVCPEYYAPVCGTDGVTYSNPCFAECAGVRVVAEGECQSEPDDFCMSSSDCREGQVCTTEDGECLMPPWCNDGAACPAVCYGLCKTVDSSRPCSSNTDCPQGFYCNSCPPYPGCPECDACGPAVCTPR